MLTYGGSVLIIVMTIALGYLFNKIFSKIINNSTLDMHNDPTNYRFLKHLIIASFTPSQDYT